MPAPLRRTNRTACRDGVALAITLWALVIGGALLTIAVFIGLHEQRAAGNGRRLHRALTGAESRLASVLRDWSPVELNRRLPRPFDTLVIAGPGVIHRLGDGLFLYRATVRDSGATAATRAAVSVQGGHLVTVRPTAVEVPGALTARDSVVLGAGSVVDGRDAPPAAWPDCPPGDSGVAGVVAASANVTEGAVVDGSPAILWRQGNDSMATPLDSSRFDSLASQASVQLPGGAWQTPPQRVGESCDTDSLLNWGDPADPAALCGGYVPIIHVNGDLTLLGGEGQGILLVDGNLELAGPYRFSGIVVVRGGIDTPSPSAAVALQGAVFSSRVGSAALPASSVAITFSKCIIDRVLRSSGRLIPLRSRSWKQLFEVP